MQSMDTATTKSSNNGAPRYDVDQVKAAAVGRTLEILRDVAGIPREILDNARVEHPCPKCGGVTRCRLVDREAGSIYCSHCFTQKNGDFLAAVGWARDMSFSEAITACGEYLKVEPRNGKSANLKGESLMVEFCRQKRILPESLKAYGAKASTRGKAHTILVPMRDHEGNFTGHQDYGLEGELAKGLTNKGGKTGLFFPGMGPGPGDDVILVEGVKDAAALHSRGYKLAIGTPGTIFKRAWASAFAGCRVILIPDRDQASREFFTGVRKMLAGVAKSVGWVELPFEETPTGGRDVRDLLATDGGEAKLSALIADAVVSATSPKPGETGVASTDQQQRQTIEPGTRVYATDKGNYGTIVADHGESCTVHFRSPDGQEADVELPKSQLCDAAGAPMGDTESEPPGFVTSLLTSADFDAATYRMEYLIRDILVAGQPCVGGGRSKTLKTTLIGIDMVISLGSGTPFLGHFETKRSRVAFWSGESGAATIQAKARRVAESRDVKLSECDVLWSFSLPKLGRIDHVGALAGVIEEHSLDVVVIDPLYLSLIDGSETGRPGDLFFMGSKLLPLSEMGQATGCTIVVLHHFRKAGNGDEEEVALEELSQSGVAEWARQWLLLARRSPFKHDGRHELWMRAGGSAGHAGLYGVDVNEGTIDEHFDGRTWEVEVKPEAEVIQATKKTRIEQRVEKQMEEDEAGQQMVIKALSKLPKGKGVFKSRLYELTGIGEKRLGRLLTQLAGQGIVESCRALQSPTHKTPREGAFCLANEWYEE